MKIHTLAAGQFVEFQLQLQRSYLRLNLHFHSSHHLHVSFLLQVQMNSPNWPGPNVWVFRAQLVEHCSANTEAMGLNPVEDPKFLFLGQFAID